MGAISMLAQDITDIRVADVNPLPFRPVDSDRRPEDVPVTGLYDSIFDDIQLPRRISDVWGGKGDPADKGE